MSQAIELIANPSQAIDRVDELQDEIEVALYNRTNKLTQMFADRVRQNLSGDVLQTRSGDLLGSVEQIGPNATGDEIVSTVQAGGDAAPYGIVHEHGGEREYMIYPVNGRALAFEIDGKLAFFASVRHPPLPARPWFGPVEEEMAAIWGDELQEAISEVVGR